MQHIESTQQLPSYRADLFVPPPSTGFKLAAALRQCGATVLTPSGEADRFVAWYCQTIRAFAVLSEDSDFFVLPVRRYMRVRMLRLQGPHPAVFCHHRAELIRAIKLPEPAYPLVPSLLGNDYVPHKRLEKLHATFRGGDQTAHARLDLTAMVDFIRQHWDRDAPRNGTVAAAYHTVITAAMERGNYTGSSRTSLEERMLASALQYEITPGTSSGFPRKVLHLHPRLAAALGADTVRSVTSVPARAPLRQS